MLSHQASEPPCSNECGCLKCHPGDPSRFAVNLWFASARSWSHLRWQRIPSVNQKRWHSKETFTNDKVRTSPFLLCKRASGSRSLSFWRNSLTIPWIIGTRPPPWSDFFSSISSFASIFVWWSYLYVWRSLWESNSCTSVNWEFICKKYAVKWFIVTFCSRSSRIDLAITSFKGTGLPLPSKGPGVWNIFSLRPPDPSIFPPSLLLVLPALLLLSLKEKFRLINSAVLLPP